MRSWFTIDGRLDDIDYAGESFFRFPQELAEIVISTYSRVGDRLLDPFCGFGTTLVAAQRLGRTAIGIEKDSDRAAFAASQVTPSSLVICADARDVADLEIGTFDLVFTSPPYTTFRDWTDGSPSPDYLTDLRTTFDAVRGLLNPGAVVVVEASNVRDQSGVRTVAWDIAQALRDVFTFRGEVVRCNTGPEPAGPDYDHSYLLVFDRPG